jgi:hypothetical protein
MRCYGWLPIGVEAIFSGHIQHCYARALQDCRGALPEDLADLRSGRRNGIADCIDLRASSKGYYDPARSQLMTFKRPGRTCPAIRVGADSFAGLVAPTLRGAVAAG